MNFKILYLSLIFITLVVFQKTTKVPNTLSGDYKMTGTVYIPIAYQEKTENIEKYVDNTKLGKKTKKDVIINTLNFNMTIEDNYFSFEITDYKLVNKTLKIKGFLTEDLQHIQQLTVEENYENPTNNNHHTNKHLIYYSIQNLELKDSSMVGNKVKYLYYRYGNSSSIHESDMAYNFVSNFENDMRIGKSSTKFLYIDRELFEKRVNSKLPSIEIKFFLQKK